VNYNPEFGENSNCTDLDNYGVSETSLYNFVLEGGRKKTFVSYEQRLANMVVNDGAELDPPSDIEG
jgi:hypothetical protein